MEDNTRLMESLLERTVDYSKTSIELIKLKALDKTSDVVSTILPHSVVLFMIASFMLFLNIGLSFWLGKLLGETFYGFFVVAAFYGLIGIIIHLFMHNWFKKIVYNYIIKQVLN